jgi:hypothetical protein
MFLNKFARIVCLIAVWAFAACSTGGNSGDTAQDTTTAAVDTATVPATTAGTTDSKVLGGLPPTSEVPAMLQLSGADFNPSLVNSAGKATGYTTTTDKAALNLGIYATDIGYLSVYDKTQDVITYLKSAEKLANHLGLNNTFGAEMQQRFQRNLNNKDSLVKIVDESMNYVNSFLKEGNRDATAALIVTGSFVEGLYVSTGLVEKYPKDVPADVRNQTLTQLIVSITKQEQSLDDLINILQEVKSDPQAQTYLTEMQDLKKQFEALNLDEQIRNNRGGLMINDKTLTGISAKVKQIRSRIIG